jgi:DNA-binding IclR family transcriptional regulator
MQNKTYLERVPAADQAIRILFCLAHNSPQKLKLSEICQQVGINKSKGYALLSTLLQHGLVTKEPAGKTYALGLELLYLSRKLLDDLGYRELAAPHLESLAQATRATAMLCLIKGSQAYVAAKQDAAEPIGINIMVGAVFPATHGAHGLAMAAFLPPTELEALLRQPALYFLGDPAATAAALDQVREELQSCRRLGYAKDPGRLQPGLNAVSAPVFGPQGRVMGCLVVVGAFPTILMDSHGVLVRAAAKTLSHNLGAPSGIDGAGPQR